MTGWRPARWAEVPLRHTASEPAAPTLVVALGRPGLALAVAVVLGLLGHIVLAVVAVGLAVALTHALVIAPGTRSSMVRLERRISSLVGSALGVVLLLPLHLLVVTPLGLAFRAFGVRPLERGTSRSSRSTWLTASGPQGSTRTRTRMYSRERRWRPVEPPRQGRALVLRTIVAVLLVQGAVMGVARLIDRRTTPEPELVGTASPAPGRSAALADQPWMDDLLREQAEVSSGIVYAPFVGSTLRDYHGEHITVERRVRRSYEPAFAPGVEPIDVWFFGGSTMFGFDALRDLHTIPSQFVRAAERAGIAVRARNYGGPGLVNFQETVQLALSISEEERPDLVVFYDGINDVTLQIINAIGGLNPLGEPGSLGDRQQRTALFDSGAVPGGSPAAPDPMRPPIAEPPYTADDVARAVASVYRQGMEVAAALAEREGFEVLHFWQPTIYTKEPLHRDEASRLEVLGFDAFQFEVMTALYRHVTEALPPGVIDLTDALDDVPGPVLVDNAHINETGADAVARAMFTHARPSLEGLRSRG